MSEEERALRIGRELIQLLGLRPDKNATADNVVYYTNAGTKTELGLGRTIIRLVEDTK